MNKTIKINPEIFNIGKKSRKNQEKKENIPEYTEKQIIESY